MIRDLVSRLTKSPFMKSVLLPLLVACSLSSCVMFQPRVVDWQDPFTAQASRTMSVGESNQSIFLAALAAYPYVAPGLTTNNMLGMAISGRDTTMTFVRWYPERAFDVPADGQIALKFVGSAKNGGGAAITYLPLLRGYHTTNGALVVIGRVNKTAMALLERNAIDIVRIDPVRVNESDPTPLDWYLSNDYAQAFKKGVPMLLGWKQGSNKPMRDKQPRAGVPRDDRGLIRRLGKKK